MLVLNIKELTGDIIINIGGDIEVDTDILKDEPVVITGPVEKLKRKVGPGRPPKGSVFKKVSQTDYNHEYYLKNKERIKEYSKKSYAKKALASKA